MNGTINLKSGFMYDVTASNIKMANNIPMSGTLKLNGDAISQFSKDASEFGSWKSAMELKLTLDVNGSYHDLEILLNEPPIDSAVSFQTVSVESAA